MLLIPEVALPAAPRAAIAGTGAETADDALAAARQLLVLGFPRLQLRLATGARATDATAVDAAHELLRQLETPLQIVVGDTDFNRCDDLLAAGADYLVLNALHGERHRLEDVASAAPGQVIAAIELASGRPTTAAQRSNQSRNIFDLIAELEPLPLAALQVQTSALAERLGEGDLPLLERLVDVSPWPVQLAGGAASVLDLRNVADRGVAAAVLLANAPDAELDRPLLADLFHPVTLD